MNKVASSALKTSMNIFTASSAGAILAHFIKENYKDKVEDVKNYDIAEIVSLSLEI